MTAQNPWILHTKPKIVNLSSYELTSEQMELLSLGLKFTLTPQRNQDELIANSKDFARQLRLGQFFLDTTNTEDSLVKNRSSFVSP